MPLAANRLFTPKAYKSACIRISHFFFTALSKSRPLIILNRQSIVNWKTRRVKLYPSPQSPQANWLRIIDYWLFLCALWTAKAHYLVFLTSLCMTTFITAATVRCCGLFWILSFGHLNLFRISDLVLRIWLRLSEAKPRQALGVLCGFILYAFLSLWLMQ